MSRSRPSNRLRSHILRNVRTYSADQTFEDPTADKVILSFPPGYDEPAIVELTRTHPDPDDPNSGLVIFYNMETE